MTFAAAVVAHSEFHMLPAQATAPFGCLVGRAQAMAQLHPQGASGLIDGVDRVGAQIQHGLFNLRGIGQYRRAILVDIGQQSDMRWKGHLDQAQGFFDHLSDL